MVFPVRPVVHCAALAGQTNGKLDPAILVDTPGQAGGPTVRLVPPTARKWRALCAAALKAGFTLKASGAADSYRPYTVQASIFRQRYSTTRMAGSLGTKAWNGVTWYQKPGTATAATPGTSNHGWGEAIDTGQETDGDPGAESIGGPALDWLVAHELEFGFSHELQSEPWHIHDFTGDTIPQAVLDYEHGSTPPPPTPPVQPAQENDMPTVVAVQMVLNPAKRTAGYTLDAQGGIHPFGGAVPFPPHDDGYWAAAGPARQLEVTDWAKPAGYILDALGGIHPLNGTPAIVGNKYWKGGFVPPAPPT